tara:strand:- start:188 stop:646 length:459 start_codon:yes stop_codon:yes gene_type:complete
MKPKIPAHKVLSDACAINVGQVVEDGAITTPGTPYYIHAGEWVEVMPVMTVREVMQISKLQNSSGDSTQLGENLTTLCEELSRRVVAWNWTDLMGEAMEQPYNRPDVLEGLSSEELLWLMSATNGGESVDARKKDSEQSENTSLEMALNQKQ